MKLMAELGRTEGEGDASSDQTMQNMMQKMMKNLLSKELCYTPLKEISTMVVCLFYALYFMGPSLIKVI